TQPRRASPESLETAAALLLLRLNLNGPPHAVWGRFGDPASLGVVIRSLDRSPPFGGWDRAGSDRFWSQDGGPNGNGFRAGRSRAGLHEQRFRERQPEHRGAPGRFAGARSLRGNRGRRPRPRDGAGGAAGPASSRARGPWSSRRADSQGDGPLRASWPSGAARARARLPRLGRRSAPVRARV